MHSHRRALKSDFPLIIAVIVLCSGVTGAWGMAAASFLHETKASGAFMTMDHAEVIDGGPNDNFTVAIRTDAAGNVYVAGNSSDPQFIAPAPGFGTDDIPVNCNYGCSYVIKYNANFTPVYTVILAGSEAHAMAIDSQGDVFLAGEITFLSEFPFTAGAYVTGPGAAGSLGFVTKINPSGTALVYSTGMDYLDNDDGIVSIALDSAGDCYFLSSSGIASFPVTADAIQNTPGGVSDAVIGEFDSTGSQLLYGTFLGGSDNDAPAAMYLDSSGSELYVAGITSSADFPVTMGSYAGGANDGFVAKINLQPQKSLAYARYIGGSDGENLTAITGAEDGSGDVFVGGNTASTDFPVTSGAYQTTLGGRASAFVTRLAPDGTIEASTLFGGEGLSQGFTETMALAPDGKGGVYSGGFTTWGDLPTSTDAVQDFNVSGNDISTLGGPSGYITEFTPTLSAIGYSSLYGGEATARYLNEAFSSVQGLWTTQTGALYAVGSTNTIDFPLTVYSPDDPAFATPHFTDGFWSRYSPSSMVITTPTYLPLALLRQSYSVNFGVSGGTPPYTWSIAAESAPADLSLSDDGVLSGTVNPDDFPPGYYVYYHRDFTVKVTDSTGLSAYKGFDLPWDVPMDFSGPSVADGTVNQHLGLDQYSCNGGSYEETCELGAGSLPLGMTLTCQTRSFHGCVVKGTPTKAGTFTFRLFSTDILGQQLMSQPFKIVISDEKTDSGDSGGGGGGALTLWELVGFGFLSLIALGHRQRCLRCGSGTWSPDSHRDLCGDSTDEVDADLDGS